MFKPPPKLNKHSTPEDIEEFHQIRKDYITSCMPGVQTQFCNFGHKYDTIKNIQDLMRFDFTRPDLHLKDLTPLKIRVECTIYHGCDELLEKGKSKQVSKEMYFDQNISFDQMISFDNLKYCQIPNKTRLSFNIILIFQ